MPKADIGGLIYLKYFGIFFGGQRFRATENHCKYYAKL